MLGSQYSPNISLPFYECNTIAEYIHDYGNMERR
jgi:hypothetical protein